MNQPIGMIDSGVGGVSVLFEALRLLPEERFLFYGDNANAPYGDQPLERIQANTARCVGASGKRARPSRSSVTPLTST